MFVFLVALNVYKTNFTLYRAVHRDDVTDAQGNDDDVTLLLHQKCPAQRGRSQDVTVSYKS